MTAAQKARISETVHINIYRDVDKLWRARFLRRVFGTIEIIADGGQGVKNRSDCLKTVGNMIKGIQKGNVKIAITALLMACAISLSAFAQVAEDTGRGVRDMPRATTKAGDIRTTDTAGFLGDVWDILVGPGGTNLSGTVYGTYTPSIKKWGEGVILMRNIPLGQGIGTGIGIGVDRYADSIYAVAGELTLNYAIRPLAGFGGWATNIVTTPFGYFGVGTPFGGSASTGGSLETISAAGLSLHLAKVLGMSLEAQGMYGTRTGLGDLSGPFWGGGLTLIRRF